MEPQDLVRHAMALMLCYGVNSIVNNRALEEIGSIYLFVFDPGWVGLYWPARWGLT